LESCSWFEDEDRSGATEVGERSVVVAAAAVDAVRAEEMMMALDSILDGILEG